MHGNLWESVADWWETHLGYDPVTDPSGPVTGSYLVIRGGSWGNYAKNSRSAYRNHDAPSGRNINIGFRLARSE